MTDTMKKTLNYRELLANGVMVVILDKRGIVADITKDTKHNNRYEIFDYNTKTLARNFSLNEVSFYIYKMIELGCTTDLT